MNASLPEFGADPWPARTTSADDSDRKRSVLVGAVAVVLLTTVFVTQRGAARIAAGQEVVWPELVAHYLALWTLWGVMAPLIVRVTRRIGSKGLSIKLLLHLPVGAVFCVMHITLWAVSMWWVRGQQGVLPPSEDFQTAVLSSLGSAFTIYLAIVAGGYAFNYYRALRERELDSIHLESRLVEARLHALQGQLQPHFLFNTLHAISALMEEDIQAARRMMSNLSSLLRFSLDHNPGREIPLEKELQVLRQYLEIQKTRFGDRLTVESTVEPEALGCSVPYLIFQPLVENAIRHGLEPRRGSCHLEIAASVDDGRLSLTVRDDGAGLGKREIEEGVGLSNTRERLGSLYGEEATLRLRDRDEGGAEVTLILPVRENQS